MATPSITNPLKFCPNGLVADEIERDRLIQQHRSGQAKKGARPSGMKASTNDVRPRAKTSDKRLSPWSNYDRRLIFNENDINTAVGEYAVVIFG